MKKMYKKKAFLNVKAMLVMALVCFMAMPGFAENWTGNKAGRTFTQNTVLDVTGTVTLTGTQIISSGTVTINASGANRTIQRGAKNFAMFDVRNGATLIINGGTYKITIDGRAGTYPGDAASSVDGTDSWGHSAIQVRVGGTATLTDVTIKSNYLRYSVSNPDNKPQCTHGGGIFVRGTLTCNNCIISDCRSEQGGGICVFSGGNATLNGGKIHNCQSFGRAGGACVINSTNNGGLGNNTPSGSSAVLMLNGVEIYENISEKSFGGGGYSEFVGAKLIVTDNTIIRNNQSQSGGHGVCVADMGDIELRVCDIHNNTATNNTDYGGGGLYIGGTVDVGATAYVYEGCKIRENVARRGGGIYMATNMHLVIEGGEIYDNSTNGTTNDVGGYGSGGGVYMGRATRSRASSFTMNGGKIYNNTATGREGGGVYIGSGIVTITGGEMFNNNAGADGGGIYLYSGSVNMTGGEVYRNNANGSANNGGGFYLGGGDFTMSGSAKMYSNTAYDGAGLYLNNGTFKMQGGEVYGNVAANYGGGAYLTANCTFTMTGGSLGKVGEDKNSALTGGGLYDLGSFSMTDGNIVNNEATGSGGEYGHGGGAYIKTTVATPLNGGAVAGNTATVNGAGLYITGDAGSTTDVTVTGTSFYGNVAGNHGGGLYLTNTSRFTLNGGSIGVDGQAKNSAKRGGGINDLGSFTMNSGTITNNEATNGEGGGAFINTTFATVLSNGIVSNNNAYGSSGHGGGVYIQGGTAVTVGGVSIYGNSAEANGGGVYLTGSASSFTMTGGAIGIEGAPNTARDGGGAYINAPFSMTGGSIGYNTATRNGGGAHIPSSAETTITDGIIISNTAGSSGGGIYLSSNSGLVTVNNAVFESNAANWTNGQGGGIYANGAMIIKGTSSFIKNEANLGGAATVNNGRFTMQGGIVGGSQANANKARRRGGGFYVTGSSSTVELQGGEVSYNEANTADDGQGGGLCVNNGSMTVSGATAVIKNNIAKMYGGGVYVANGTFSMTGGNLGGTTAQGNATTGYQSQGGGLYMGGGTAEISDGSISGNHTDSNGMGGGIYMSGGSCTLSGGANIGGDNASYANNALYGGGIYSAGGAILVKGGQINYNIADADGGGIYSNEPGATVSITKEGTTSSYMQYNTAVNGGGIFANRGEVDFEDGFVNFNFASTAGGGMYVNDEGTLNLKGNAVLNHNHVPTGMKGGGVYLKGTVVVGESSKAQSSITADSNFAHTLVGSETAETYEPDNQTRNNIYLPAPVANPYTEENHRDVITVIEDGIDEDSHVGFSVPHNHVPVIYCAKSSTSRNYLDKFTTGEGHTLNTVLFDDTYHYLSVHYHNNPYFDPDHVYLYGFWPQAVTSLAEVPEGGFVVDGNTITIGNEEGFAWLISYVNGLNGQTANDCSGVVVNLEADLDMKMFGWVPIGFKGNDELHDPAPFRGTFNGNGHLIEGINGMVYGQGDEGVRDYGLFGYVNGGTIENVFLKGAEYYVDDNPLLVLGALVSELDGNGNVNNSEASGTLVTQSPDAILGGLVGRMGNNGTGTPTIHSTMAITDMTGGIMGGLLGYNAKGNLVNSFSNAKFTRLDNATEDHYCGGLVGVNRGRVENCYARLRGTAPDNFGRLVGDNAGGTLKYSYATATGYTVAGKEGTVEGLGTYGITVLPYLYAHRDTQVDATNDYVPTDANADKQMMKVLNKWVETNSTSDMAYTKWGRPWQVSDDEKPLNDDYPILRMPEYEAVAATAGDPYLYYGSVDDLMGAYTDAGEAIWMYNNSESVTGDNTSSSAKLYIAEDVALLNDNALKAYVGITLDNSAGANGVNPTYGVYVGVTSDATDWHMISSSLRDAHLGIDYAGDENLYDFSLGHPAGMPYYRFFPKDNASNGYFPSHRFGEEYSNDNTSASAGGNYYKEWDFYSYDEPNYHWINFKRNSASHHHFDTEGHETIEYDNEEYLTAGKGYFAATREETFLQCQGHLNAGGIDDEVTYNLTLTPGVPRHGYNLIGNPYQAYLDFDAFAENNSDPDEIDAIWNDATTASYTILDEDAKSYLTFAYDGSDNPDAAGRFIHPHQGFFVLLRDRVASTAHFYPDQRSATAKNVEFRSEGKTNYPLVNLFVSEENGNGDMVTVELGRPDKGGAPLMQGLRTGNGKIWCSYEGDDYAVAYTQPGVTEAAIRFESVEDTEYTMRWNTHNGDFSYLHLIDNKTGADVDCLTTDEYKFSASQTDYKSRFRLVFGYTGIEDPETVEADQNFAFVMGDELVVTGEGTLQVFDVNGRLVASQELHGVQTTMALPNVANGVYVMRLTEGKQSRVQKMVISK